MLSGPEFVGIIEEQCDAKKIKIKDFSAETGISSANLSQWRTGIHKPTRNKVKIVCDFFQISIDGITPTVKKVEKSDGDELLDLLTALRDREDMRMLFKLAKGATPDDVRQAVKIIEALRK